MHIDRASGIIISNKECRFLPFMEIVAGEIDLRIGYFYLNAIFTVVGRKRNAFTVIKCDIVVDNIATDLCSVRAS